MTMTNIFGRSVLVSLVVAASLSARLLYFSRASKRMLKSSSAVQDVLDTRRAGLSGLSAGIESSVKAGIFPAVLLDGRVISVKYVVYCPEASGRKSCRDFSWDNMGLSFWNNYRMDMDISEAVDQLDCKGLHYELLG